MEDEVKNYLGIDWGEAKIGLALADEETRMAFAFNALKNDGNTANEIINIIKNENVKEVVIGVPSYVNIEKTVYAGKRLGKKIEKEINIPVHYQNEMFTTKMAQANLIKKGMKHVGKSDDQEAARIILQEWLDINGKK